MKLNKTIIGMVHVGALPGTPKNSDDIDTIIQKALSDANILQGEGVDAIMIENMHDRPYLNKRVGPEIIASMTVVAAALRNTIELPLGIQILAGANQEALAVALASGLNFIRAEAFVYGHIADEGFMNSDAGNLLRYRKQIGAESISVFTDIKKKHSSHFITNDISIEETAKASQYFLSDGVIVTGTSTGEEASIKDVRDVKKSVQIPVIIGSGIDTNNIQEYWKYADAFIVGSSFKKNGNWENEVDKERVHTFMKKINILRSE